MADLNKIIKNLSSLTVVEAAELSKQLEEKWGVTAAAAVAAAPPPAAPVEEKDEFTIMLTAAGDKKINVIKEIRTITTLGLKEAKGLADNGGAIKEDCDAAEADEIKTKLEGAGASVELK